MFHASSSSFLTNLCEAIFSWFHIITVSIFYSRTTRRARHTKDTIISDLIFKIFHFARKGIRMRQERSCVMFVLWWCAWAWMIDIYKRVLLRHRLFPCATLTEYGLVNVNLPWAAIDLQEVASRVTESGYEVRRNEWVSGKTWVCWRELWQLLFPVNHWTCSIRSEVLFVEESSQAENKKMIPFTVIKTEIVRTRNARP